MHKIFLIAMIPVLLAAGCGGDVAAPETEAPTPTPAERRAWAWQNPIPSANSCIAIEALGDGRTLLLTESDAFETDDGGVSWKSLDELGSGFFVDSYRHGDVVTVLSAGHVHVSTDRGRSWRSTRFGSLAREAAAFVDGKHGIVTASGGAIITTDDGGDTWTQRFSGTVATLADVA